MDQLNSREQQEFQKVVEQKQMKDFMRVSSYFFDPPFDCFPVIILEAHKLY